MRILFFLFLTVMFSNNFANPFKNYSFDQITDAKRFQTLINETRCVVCQNQNIAESTAPLTNDLRDKIYLMVKNHLSDQSIKFFLVKRYGEFVLLKPRFVPINLFLWLFPPTLLLIAILVFCFFFKSKQA